MFASHYFCGASPNCQKKQGNLRRREYVSWISESQREAKIPTRRNPAHMQKRGPSAEENCNSARS
jgi:hypothetical protein